MNMRQDIEFNAERTTLRGWLYTPDSGKGPFPTIVMAHGFSAVKEMYLDSFAEVFAGAGLAALVFDNRNFG
jgi:dienelactone hydrolase